MVVFTLVNSQSDGGYYIASTRTSMGWRGLPHDLANEVEDVRRKGEEVEEVSIGLDGDWFLRTNARHACKTEHYRTDMVSNVELFAQLAVKAGLDLAHYAIQFFAFVPDPSGYVTVLHKADGSLTRCVWHNAPSELDRLLEREAPKGVRHVTVGVNGSHVVILNSGLVWWSGVPESLDRLLDDAERRGRAVTTVSLSLIAPTWFFIEFADGATEFSLPRDWHEPVNRHTALSARSRGPTMVTAYNNSIPLSSPLSPLSSYHGSFSPSSLYYPNLGYNSFAANPYLSSVFAAPPPQPMYNFTNVYNSVPQTQPMANQQNNGNDNVIQLLGGALKVAGAVLPMFTGGAGTGFGGF
ncbi:hypothetical protein B0F90DRAFT_1815493 [Multifurca ochricompacta]|uniref:Uncharacterized protein n=1 Tax=Multifurca ochricompacta TaxID=376703 RepID=A0AAD4M7H2_9AGAM|nr:hypothetical protein B0F90DRAFT_1815493 [Multifurca ochricompacta]